MIRTILSALICIAFLVSGCSYHEMITSDLVNAIKDETTPVYMYCHDDSGKRCIPDKEKLDKALAQGYVPFNFELRKAINDILLDNWRIWYPNFVSYVPRVYIRGTCYRLILGPDYIVANVENDAGRSTPVVSSIKKEEFEKVKLAVLKALQNAPD